MTEFTFLACQHLDTVMTCGEVDQNTASAIRQVIKSLQQQDALVKDLSVENEQLRSKLAIAEKLVETLIR